jgi:hypothetical protein
MNDQNHSFFVELVQIYACFIDLRKAFDSVIHSALFLKLLRAKIWGKFLALLKSLYSNLSLRVIVEVYKTGINLY